VAIFIAGTALPRMKAAKQASQIKRFVRFSIFKQALRVP
jgi:hypothetical protein